MVTSWLLPATADQNASVGTSQWININNIKLVDGALSESYFIAGPENPIIRRVHLIKGGIMQTAYNHAADEIMAFTGTNTYGGASDLWSNTLTPTDVNDPGFGIAIAMGTDASGVKTDDSYYLLASGFNANIPPSATIDGIEVEFWTEANAAGGGTARIGIDYVRIKVHYTWAPKVQYQGYTTGYVYSPAPDRPIPRKRFVYKVYKPNGDFVGVWNDVSSEPTFKRDINAIMAGNMTVNLARNELSNPGVPTLGAGSDLELNYDVEVVAYYGYTDVWVDENGSPVVDENGEFILMDVGQPGGKVIYTGYVSKWDLEVGGNDSISANLMSHGNEINQIMLETDDSVAVEYAPPWGGGYVGISGGGPTDNDSIAQSFTMVGTKKVSRISIPMRRWEGGVEVTMYLYGPSGLIAVATATPPDFQSWNETSFIFSNTPQLDNGVGYTMYFYTDVAKTGGNVTYPAQFQYQGGYGGGTLYIASGGGGYVDSGTDLLFTVWEAGGDTQVTFNSIDPSVLLKNLIDFARSRGSRVQYHDEDIIATNTEISITFNANSVGEAVGKVPALCPADWILTFDPSDNSYGLKPRPAIPNHYVTLGKDASKLHLSRSIEQIVNQVYFTGGGTPALYTKVTDQQSRNDWRPGLEKLSDNRVTLEDTAKLLSQADINRKKDPLYAGSLTLANTDLPIEDYELGDLLGFQGYGSFIDDLELQMVSYTYHPDFLEVPLETLLPKQNQRVEDIKRNLDLEQQKNNPAAPS